MTPFEATANGFLFTKTLVLLYGVFQIETLGYHILTRKLLLDIKQFS